MLQENVTYKVQLVGLDTPEGKNMKTLRIAIPSELTIFRGVSIFLDNTKNAAKTLDIWLSNIMRQKEMDAKVPDIGHIEYLQEFQNKYSGKDPEKVAVAMMLKMLEKLADDRVEFECTYVRTFSEKNETWYTNLVPYKPNDTKKNNGLSVDITK